MTQHQPITSQELEEMKKYCYQHTMWVPMIIEHDGKKEELRCAPVEEAARMARAALDLPRCIAEIEWLDKKLSDSIATNAALRKEVAKVMVALDKGEINMSLDLMNEFYRILGLEPPYPPKQ